MKDYELFYATNRNHVGPERFRPQAYGPSFSNDGLENLRFGRLTVSADETVVAAALAARNAGAAVDGEALANHFEACMASCRITAYEEQIDRSIHEDHQPAVLGSDAFFADLGLLMRGGTDVVVFVHGFNVSWTRAVASALALEASLNREDGRDPKQRAKVVLFTWPSDGLALPFVSYKSDRTEAAASGYAIGRAFLRLRDFLATLKDRSAPEELCGQSIHLLCHSMGNYVLENALVRLGEHSAGRALPRMFEYVFLCSADVDDDALEPGNGLGRVHEIARRVSVYSNRGDKALVISDYTKGNPERLGSNGAANARQLHNKIELLDASFLLIPGIVEHSYYASGATNLDIRHSIEGVDPADPVRLRLPEGSISSKWILVERRQVN
ncbi:MAG TPA: alpha/beta fold hydrolase [Polyangiaceae bacterium]|jgi:esterase/lipase superfamily enzyme|nr:alpha/beta fold hydrolase [Polyangiaceae bacterium]